MRITRTKAINIIKQHGNKPTDQTACRNGVMLESGSSFFEQLGNKMYYDSKVLAEWLGY